MPLKIANNFLVFKAFCSICDPFSGERDNKLVQLQWKTNDQKTMENYNQ